jgi:23S rRNA (guanosine2251-2'-O)-methyltransferase
VIESWLAVSPKRLRRIWVRPKPRGRLANIAETARSRGIAVEELGEDRLNQLSGTGRHQGIVAQVHEFQYAPIERIASSPSGAIVVLDQIQDPRNLGAILRTAAAVSAAGVVLPKDGTVGITATVEVAAAGTAAFLPIARVTNLVRTVKWLQEKGYWAVALDAGGALSIFDIDARGRTLLVVGGEGGVRPLLRSTCDQTASIPMGGSVESLNVSVAAGVALYQLYRREPRAGDRLP